MVIFAFKNKCCFKFLHDIKMPKSAVIAHVVLIVKKLKQLLSILVSNLLLDRQRTYFHINKFQIKNPD